MATPNPMAKSFGSQPHVSTKTFAIGGIKTTVYGVDELPSRVTEVACLWLLHPRLAKQEHMAPFAQAIVTRWNQALESSGKQTGLIAVAFDQRNHGTRLVDPAANEDWRGGNSRHAPDMFSSFHGTSLDTSQLITYLPAYVFPGHERHITSNMVLGVSLGGHAAWHCILHEPRITTAVIIIGCADYVSLMKHRASKSKLKAWDSTSPPGAKFLGSESMPAALLEAVKRYDPTGVFHSGQDTQAVLKSHLQGKRIFNIAGGADKLVPYSCSKAFLEWLKAEGDGIVAVKDTVYDGAGHEVTKAMAQDATDYIVAMLDHNSGGSKI